MIQLTDVTKVYPGPQGEVRAIDGVTLAIGAGEFVAVRGPSGCGKSTLLALVGGLALPTAGDVRVGQYEVSRLSPAGRAAFRAASVGFVFQLFHLLPYLSVFDNVLLGAGPRDGRAARDEAAVLLERFGLGERRLHRPGQLSAGERQRVALARALLNRPKLLLADEPTGNLDAQSAAVVRDLIAQFHQGSGTVLLVTHDDAAAARAQRSVSLAAGRIVDPRLS
jgi:putative ABC transport system ATP-binding protein